MAKEKFVLGDVVFKKDQTMAKTLVTAQSLAETLSLKPETILEWARRKKIPSIRISPKVVRFHVDTVQKVLLGKHMQADQGTEQMVSSANEVADG